MLYSCVSLVPRVTLLALQTKLDLTDILSEWNSFICRGFTVLKWLSQKEKNIVSIYLSIYIWNLEKWYWWTYLQGRNGNIDVENGLDMTGKVEEGTNWESSTDIYIWPCVKHG